MHDYITFIECYVIMQESGKSILQLSLKFYATLHVTNYDFLVPSQLYIGTLVPRLRIYKCDR